MKATVTAINGLNIRKEPHAGAEIARKAAAFGEELNVSLVHDGWCEGDKGYFMAKFVDIVEGSANDNAVEKHEQPSLGSDADDSVPEVASADDEAGEAATGDEAAELNKLKVPQLVKLAKESGIEVKAGAKKAEIIKAILNAD